MLVNLIVRQHTRLGLLLCTLGTIYEVLSYPTVRKGGFILRFNFRVAHRAGRAAPSFKNKAENGAPMNRSTDPPHNILEDLVCSL